MTKANVDCKEDISDDDSNSSEHTHDGVDDGVDGQQLVNSTVPRWSVAYR